MTGGSDDDSDGPDWPDPGARPWLGTYYVPRNPVDSGGGCPLPVAQHGGTGIAGRKAARRLPVAIGTT